jgi:hypothetical protein
MSILGTIFSGGAKDLVEGVGGVIDDLHTSEEEKLEAAQKIKELISNYEVEMEKTITERWKVDMNSDSWLSKNINGGVDLGLGKTHFASNEDTQTLDTDWGADTTASDNDSDLIVLDGSGTEFPAGTTIYGMYDYVELHSGSIICYVAPRHDYPGTRAAAI